MAIGAWRREDGAAIVLSLHVQPGARRTEAAGVYGDAVKIRVAAPAVEGKANAVLLRFIANAFDVPMRNVTLIRGETSRDKIVEVKMPVRRPDWCR
jgi:uncharacterized protein (TIGR00251 family)